MRYLRLIRFPNLLMIILMQVLLRYTLAGPILMMEGKGLLLTNLEFALLVLSCVFIAAGGYIINDIEDVRIDSINKPDKVLIGQKISEDAAYNLYMGLTFCGILAGFYLTFVKEYNYIGYISLLSAGLLYFYATTYKCIPLLGNFIVAILTSVSIWIVILPEPFAKDSAPIVYLVFGYMLFAFLITMVREIVKDMEDLEGDQACDCKTLPVSTGIRISKGIALTFTLTLILSLAWIQWTSRQWETPLPFYYLVIFVQIPLLVLAGQIFAAKESKAFRKASFTSKLIMFTGLISMFVFYFSF
jgi:4-hydroxybenzoate polyprenyltransferase